MVDGSVCSPNFIIFTFQSGSIQIKTPKIPIIARPNFTFQSGSIQIVLSLKAVRTNKTLHSNLVLFKSLRLRTAEQVK